MIQKEVWKDVKNYEGIYQVSNLGRIKSNARLIESVSSNGNKYFKQSKVRIIKPFDKIKYPTVVLRKDVKATTFTVHLIMAITFFDHKPSHKMVVDHIDNNPLNNNINNLQIITARENVSKDRKNKSSKYTGVLWSKTSNKWRAYIYIKSKFKCLGLYLNEDDASFAYQNALNQIE